MMFNPGFYSTPPEVAAEMLDSIDRLTSAGSCLTASYSPTHHST